MGEGAAVLEDAHARAFGGGGEPLGVLERMQVAAGAVVGAGDVAVGGHGGAQLLALDHADAVVTEPVVQRLDLLAKLAFLARLEGDMHLPLAQVAVDGVPCDELALQP